MNKNFNHLWDLQVWILLLIKICTYKLILWALNVGSFSFQLIFTLSYRTFDIVLFKVLKLTKYLLDCYWGNYLGHAPIECAKSRWQLEQYTKISGTVSSSYNSRKSWSKLELTNSAASIYIHYMNSNEKTDHFIISYSILAATWNVVIF